MIFRGYTNWSHSAVSSVAYYLLRSVGAGCYLSNTSEFSWLIRLLKTFWTSSGHGMDRWTTLFYFSFLSSQKRAQRRTGHGNGKEVIAQTGKGWRWHGGWGHWTLFCRRFCTLCLYRPTLCRVLRKNNFLSYEPLCAATRQFCSGKFPCMVNLLVNS
jgi:hypothetical protein